MALLIGQAVSEKIFENGGRRRTTDGRQSMCILYISSLCEPDGSGELTNEQRKDDLLSMSLFELIQIVKDPDYTQHYAIGLSINKSLT